VPDSSIQRNPLLSGKPYNAPATISQDIFDIMARGAALFGKESGFEFIGKPAYNVYEGPIFTDELRKTFWKPILEAGFPIYIINPYCGVVWPGDKIGLYSLKMEAVFWYWRANQLWRVILELYLKNKCDGVYSFLPPVYDNVVHLADTPWITMLPDEFPNHVDEFIKLSRKTRGNSAKTRNRQTSNVLTRLKEILRYKRK
jgi:hypothetical protein